jgi:valyl-tRNA synthetase
MNDEIKFHPANMKNTYKHWIDNIKDWCISRQLWWGQQIPAWFSEDGNFVVAKTEVEAIEKFKIQHPTSNIQHLKQDEDVLDTWFSSWLWPISVFDGFKEEGKEDIKYFYPTNDLVTAPEIMFFWVARMIMAGYEWMGQKPFSNVYYTGIVRDKQRRKMSKSLGNSPDPLDLIAQYGADGVRMGMLICSPAGNDILFDESQVEQGRNFANKIWNAFRLVKGLTIKPDADFAADLLASNKISEQWFDARFNIALAEIEEKCKDYKLSEALMMIYKLIWDDYCAWYLEMIKPVYGEALNQSTYDQTVVFFEKLMLVLHPFMPFITEEIWQEISERNEGASICVAAYPNVETYNYTSLQNTFETIAKIRELRNSKGISPKEAFEIIIKTNQIELYEPFQFLIKKLANVSSILFNEEAPNYVSLSVSTDQVFVKLNIEIDAVAEAEKINKEIEYLIGFMASVDVKLRNEKFVTNAKPELVEKERQKKDDALAKIEVLKQSLANL